MSIEAPAVDLSKYIERRLYGERPHIRDRRIPVAMIARRMRVNKWTVAETAYDFTLPVVVILAALLYYEEHQAEIDAQEVEEERLFQEMKSLHERNEPK